MAGPSKKPRASRKKPVKEPTSQEKQIKFHVSLRKRDKELAEEYARFEKGDWSARARELMYKGLMAERDGNTGSVGVAATIPMLVPVSQGEGGGDLEERRKAMLLENLDENFM